MTPRLYLEHTTDISEVFVLFFMLFHTVPFALSNQAIKCALSIPDQTIGFWEPRNGWPSLFSAQVATIRLGFAIESPMDAIFYIISPDVPLVRAQPRPCKEHRTIEFATRI